MTPLASQQAVDDLRAINAQFIDNFVANDVAAHDALLHPSFLYVRSDGSRVDRATYLEGWATGFDPEVIVYWDVRDELITVIGEVALVRSTNKETVRQGGAEVTSMSTYTDTYVFEGGRWLCVQAQITPVTQGNEPADDTIVSVWIMGVRQPTPQARRGASGPTQAPRSQRAERRHRLRP
jgi:ketosteroid isomerase-like protein